MQRFIHVFIASIILCGCASTPKYNAGNSSNVVICDTQKSQDCSSATRDTEPAANASQEKEAEASKALSKIEGAVIWVVAIPAIIIVAFVICPFKILSNNNSEFC